MAAEKKAYEHTSETAGFGSKDANSHQKEHQDLATPPAEDRNELTPDQRNQEKQYGPRTHQDTRITTKDGTGRE